ncbi:MAG: hypothetical protein ACI4M0_00565 [Christensenellales bacterium]
MKNTKEIRTIFAVLYYLNRLGNRDTDIENLINYAFDRIFNQNTNLLMLACIGRTKETAMDEINQILKEDTQFHEFIKRQEARKNGTL